MNKFNYTDEDIQRAAESIRKDFAFKSKFENFKVDEILEELKVKRKMDSEEVKYELDKYQLTRKEYDDFSSFVYHNFHTHPYFGNDSGDGFAISFDYKGFRFLYSGGFGQGGFWKIEADKFCPEEIVPFQPHIHLRDLQDNKSCSTPTKEAFIIAAFSYQDLMHMETLGDDVFCICYDGWHALQMKEIIKWSQQSDFICLRRIVDPKVLYTVALYIYHSKGVSYKDAIKILGEESDPRKPSWLYHPDMGQDNSGIDFESFDNWIEYPDPYSLDLPDPPAYGDGGTQPAELPKGFYKTNERQS